ncbi:MAG: YceI family protein [Gammaproteobacteria bacterium]|nr:MAG: YceI family protein [Gammaproteobacteria bacterium]|tara:strand:- start:1551 stop:2156 length:606 start_codon:yes stop_codon:yes gene_type:complete
MIYQKIRIQTFLVFLLALPSIVLSDWELVNDDSHLNFVSFKAIDFAEIHSFKEISGSIDKNGKANLGINLESLETLIPIRNERMRNLLFETQIFPNANFYLQVDLDKYLNLSIGDFRNNEAKGRLLLKNKDIETNVKFKVTRLAKDIFVVSSTEPLILNIENLGLTEGVESLRVVAGLPSISKSVPVSFFIKFRNKGEQND